MANGDDDIDITRAKFQLHISLYEGFDDLAHRKK
jgi:hypothetical protein